MDHTHMAPAVSAEKRIAARRMTRPTSPVYVSGLMKRIRAWWCSSTYSPELRTEVRKKTINPIVMA
jgi:hypothetical protein